jgi:hypothetical protein
VPREVLCKQFAAASSALVSALATHPDGSPRFVRSALAGITALLAAQDRAVWSDGVPFQVCGTRAPVSWTKDCSC